MSMAVSSISLEVCLSPAAGLVAQASAAAIIALLHAGATAKMACALVAAVARGAAAATGGGGQQDGDELEAMQEVLMVMKMSNVSETVAALRGSGRHDLARRVQKLSKMRNARAHPDAGLLGDLRQFVSGSTSTSVAVPSDEDGAQSPVGPVPNEPRQCGSPSSGGSDDTSQGVACEKVGANAVAVSQRCQLGRYMLWRRCWRCFRSP